MWIEVVSDNLVCNELISGAHVASLVYESENKKLTLHLVTGREIVTKDIDENKYEEIRKDLVGDDKVISLRGRYLGLA